MNSERATGEVPTVVPPETEESGEFENVNVEGMEESNSNSPLRNNTAVEVPATALNAVPAANTGKRPFKMEQADELAKLKNAIASAGTAVKAKAPVAAKLASARLKGDPMYQNMFENATRGENISVKYETNATRRRKNRAKAKKQGTVVNTSLPPVPQTKKEKGKKSIFSRNNSARNNSARNNSASVVPPVVPPVARSTMKKAKNMGSQASVRGVAAMSQTNLRYKNMLNTQAISGTVDAVLDIAESIEKQMGEMKRMIRTLKAKRPRAPRVKAAAVNAGTNGENNSLLGLSPLPAPPGGLNVGQGLSAIPEVNTAQEQSNNNNEFRANNGENSNAYTPPP